VALNLWTDIEYRILHNTFHSADTMMGDGVYAGKSKLRMLLGDRIIGDLRNKTVVDFGCGIGREALEIARSGAARVIGVDIDETALAEARKLQASTGLTNIKFATRLEEPVDAVVSIDSFEHFSDPEGMLALMKQMLAPGGFIAISFGPPWFHPLGGHLFSVFPWAHLIFSEDALCRWRSHFRDDGAKRFCEVQGGLNQMRIARFMEMVRHSGLEIEYLECVPIRKLRFLHCTLTREFTTSLVRAKLRKGQDGI
jgi:SAM-dependent methyltransferase